MRSVWVVAAVFSAACGGVAAEPAAQSPPPAVVAPPAPPPVAPHLALGTPVEVEITEPLSSNGSKAGATFGLKLAKPILYDGKTVVPAGLVGQGEVVDAHRSGMAGRPGELILAARFVDDGGVRIPLKALKLGMTGHNNDTVAMAVGVAVGIAAVLVPGGEVVIPAGTRSTAKLGANIDLATLPPAPSEATPVTGAPASPAPSTPTSTSKQGPTQ